MRKLFFLLPMLLAGCRSAKVVVTPVVHKDSVRVSTRYEMRYVRDTVLVHIPKLTSERTTFDTCSHLENAYALSDARINADGSLSHTLETKPQDIQKEFDKPVERYDSILIVQRTDSIPYVVEVEKRLSLWQRWKLSVGGWALSGCSVLFLLFIVLLFKRRPAYS